MLRRSRTNRAGLVAIAAASGLALVASVAPAQAAPASTGSAAAPQAVTAAGPFGAVADVSLLTLDLPSVTPAILPQTNVDLGRAIADLHSDEDLDQDKAGNQRSSAEAQTTGTTSLLGADLELQTTFASAPPNSSDSDILLDLDLSPLLDVPVIRTSAAANWISDTECVASDTPTSIADQAVADATVLGGEPLPGGGSVVALNTEDAEGAVDAESQTRLASINGPGADQRAAQARVRTDVTSLNVLNDLAGPGSAIAIDAVQNPNWIVSASGLPGGATIVGPDPAVQVNVGGGQPLITLVSGNDPVDAQLLDLNLVDLLDLDTSTGFVADLITDLFGPAAAPLLLLLDPIEDAVESALLELAPAARLSVPTVKTIEADGTRARVEGALLRVEVLVPLVGGAAGPVRDLVNQILAALGAEIGGPLVALDVAPYAAEAFAPIGGIDCGSDNPLRELSKRASAAEVAPGGTFDYEIDVPNRGPCALTNVRVTDVVSGPAGFEIIGTEPPATSNSNGTLTFDLGNLAVNETKQITISIKVPTTAKDGDDFDDNVTVTADCNGRPVTQDDKVVDTPEVKTNFRGDCSVQFSNKDTSHLQVFPGQTFSYFVQAFNSGAEACRNVVVTDTLDPRVTFVSCNKGCTNQGDKVTWTIPTLGGGSSSIFAVVVQVKEDATGKLKNTAVIKPEGKPGVTVSIDGPVIGPESILKDPNPPRRAVLARTGMEVPMALALALAGGGLVLLQVRRRSALI